MQVSALRRSPISGVPGFVPQLLTTEGVQLFRADERVFEAMLEATIERHATASAATYAQYVAARR